MRSAALSRLRGLRDRSLRALRHTRVRRAAMVAVLIGIAILAHKPILTAVARFMTVHTPIVPADVILPTYQRPLTLARTAAEWFRRGYGKQIILYRPRRPRVEQLGLQPPPEQTMRRLLESFGVPPDRIVEFGHDVDSASDLAAAMIELLGTGSRTRVIVLEWAPRSRLTWAALQKGLRGSPIDLSMDAPSGGPISESNWWQTSDGLITYFDSYLLWVVHFMR